jgi:hypothetical protein
MNGGGGDHPHSKSLAQNRYNDGTSPVGKERLAKES